MRYVGSWVVPASLVILGLMMVPGDARGQAVAFAPNVGTIPDGVGLSATPVVSADRRYVRLSVDPFFQSVNGFSIFPVPGAIAGGGNGGGGLGALGGAGGGLRSVGPGLADFASWYPELGVPRAGVSPVPRKPLKSATGRGKKPLPDPEIVPIRKTRKPDAAPGQP